MALRKIFKKGDEVLTKKCRPVEKFDAHLHQLLDDMAETMYKADGAGLAAPQVGILKRAVVIDAGEGLIELINPKIIATDGVQHEIEGCLSIPGVYGITERPMNVTVSALDRNGKPFEKSGEGLLAKAFCHELDHLDGILFTDKARILSEEELKEFMSGEDEKDD